MAQAYPVSFTKGDPNDLFVGINIMHMPPCQTGSRLIGMLQDFSISPTLILDASPNILSIQIIVN